MYHPKNLNILKVFCLSVFLFKYYRSKGKTLLSVSLQSFNSCIILSLSSHCFMSGNYYDLQVLCLMRFSMMVVVSIHRGLKDEKTSSTYIHCNIFLLKNGCKFSYFTGHTKLLRLFQKPRAISKYVCKTSLSWHYKVHSMK